MLQAAAEILQNESKVFKIVSSLVRSLAGKNFLAKIICMLQQTNMKSLCNFLFSLGGSSRSFSFFFLLVVFLKQLVSCLRSFFLAWSLRVLTCYGTNYTLAATAVGTLSLGWTV